MIAQAMLGEFEQQAPITRRYIERLPKDTLTWKPHEKSMTAGQLAYHPSSVPGGIIHLVQQNPAEVHNLPAFPQPESLERGGGDGVRGLATERLRLRRLLPLPAAGTGHIHSANRLVWKTCRPQGGPAFIPSTLYQGVPP